VWRNKITLPLIGIAFFSLFIKRNHMKKMKKMNYKNQSIQRNKKKCLSLYFLKEKTLKAGKNGIGMNLRFERKQ